LKQYGRDSARIEEYIAMDSISFSLWIARIFEFWVVTTALGDTSFPLKKISRMSSASNRSVPMSAAISDD
jgi:hypothetical protein